MHDQAVRLLRRSAMPPVKPHSVARRVALVVALAVTSLHTIAATAQVLPAPSGSVAAPPASSEGRGNVPDVARRLWRDLMCTCTEKDCEHESLEACRCDYAEKRRSEILKEVMRLGFGSPKQDDATYAAVFRDYVKVHGQEADGSQPRPGSQAPVWLEVALIAVAVATAAAMISWLVDRLRRRPIAGTNTTAPGRPSRRKKNVRRRR